MFLQERVKEFKNLWIHLRNKVTWPNWHQLFWVWNASVSALKQKCFNVWGCHFVVTTPRMDHCLQNFLNSKPKILLWVKNWTPNKDHSFPFRMFEDCWSGPTWNNVCVQTSKAQAKRALHCLLGLFLQAPNHIIYINSLSCQEQIDLKQEQTRMPTMRTMWS